jgi:hypothetical protein
VGGRGQGGDGTGKRLLLRPRPALTARARLPGVGAFCQSTHRTTTAPHISPPLAAVAAAAPQISYVQGGLAQWGSVGLELEEGPDSGEAIEDLTAAPAGTAKGGLQLGGWKLELPLPAGLLGRR